MAKNRTSGIEAKIAKWEVKKAEHQIKLNGINKKLAKYRKRLQLVLASGAHSRSSSSSSSSSSASASAGRELPSRPALCDAPANTVPPAAGAAADPLALPAPAAPAPVRRQRARKYPIPEGSCPLCYCKAKDWPVGGRTHLYSANDCQKKQA